MEHQMWDRDSLNLQNQNFLATRFQLKKLKQQIFQLK